MFSPQLRHLFILIFILTSTLSLALARPRHAKEDNEKIQKATFRFPRANTPTAGSPEGNRSFIWPESDGGSLSSSGHAELSFEQNIEVAIRMMWQHQRIAKIYMIKVRKSTYQPHGAPDYLRGFWIVNVYFSANDGRLMEGSYPGLEGGPPPLVEYLYDVRSMPTWGFWHKEQFPSETEPRFFENFYWTDAIKNEWTRFDRMYQKWSLGGTSGELTLYFVRLKNHDESFVWLRKQEYPRTRITKFAMLSAFSGEFLYAIGGLISRDLDF